MNEEQIVEGLAEAMWRDSGDPANSEEEKYPLPWELWEDEHVWVQDKWRRYAKVAIVYLGTVEGEK